MSSVDALIWARQELTRCKEHPVLVAVDNYSALYGPTGYGHWVDFKTRQALQPGQLRAVNAMRVLEHAGPARGGERKWR